MKTPDYGITTPDQLAGEIDNTYVSNNNRFVVSLIVGYSESTEPDEGVTSAEEAAAAALDLTRDGSSASTHWYVHDRKTGQTQLIEQGDFEFESH